jgi:hypothetical protein
MRWAKLAKTAAVPAAGFLVAKCISYVGESNSMFDPTFFISPLD